MHTNNTHKFFFALLTLVSFYCIRTANAQIRIDNYPRGVEHRYGIGVNIPVAATTTFNVDASMAVGTKWTAHLPLYYNPFTFSNNKKIKNFSTTPGLRYWFRNAYNPGWFTGSNIIFSHYNTGGIFNKQFRYDGTALGLGATFGYALSVGRNWNLEFETGLGVVSYKHDKYKCVKCGELKGKEKGIFLTPNKTAITLVYKLP